jgi:hypothetical protein
MGGASEGTPSLGCGYLGKQGLRIARTCYLNSERAKGCCENRGYIINIIRSRTLPSLPRMPALHHLLARHQSEHPRNSRQRMARPGPTWYGGRPTADSG